MQDALDRATHSARELARRIGVDHHDVLVVLGTGLSGAAEILSDGGDPFPLDTLPFFPQFGGAGHRPLGWSVPMGDRRVLVMGGRCHLYEGLGAAAAVHPVRTGIAAGCSTVILTAAAGSVREDLATGSIVVVEDHLNLTGQSPLEGPAFVDLVDAYAPAVRAIALGRPVRPRRWWRRTRGYTPRCTARNSRRRPRCACCAQPARTSSACPWPSRRSPPVTAVPRCSGSPS